MAYLDKLGLALLWSKIKSLTTAINATIEDNELVTAAALNDLNSRVANVSQKKIISISSITNREATFSGITDAEVYNIFTSEDVDKYDIVIRYRDDDYTFGGGDGLMWYFSCIHEDVVRTIILEWEGDDVPVIAYYLELPIRNTYYGTCTTGKTVTGKTVTCDAYDLHEGNIISVYFQNGFEAENATLNVHSTGAYPIYINSSAVSENSFHSGPLTVTFIFYNNRYYVTSIAEKNRHAPGYYNFSVDANNNVTLSGITVQEFVERCVYLNDTETMSDEPVILVGSPDFSYYYFLYVDTDDSGMSPIILYYASLGNNAIRVLKLEAEWIAPSYTTISLRVALSILLPLNSIVTSANEGSISNGLLTMNRATNGGVYGVTTLTDNIENISNKAITPAAVYNLRQSVTNGLSGKLATLVDGVNIKTINNLSILGSGNLEIEIPDLVLSNYYAPSTYTNEDLEPESGDSYEEAIGKLHKAILDNEDVTATSLVDLNSRINSMPVAKTWATNDISVNGTDLSSINKLNFGNRFSINVADGVGTVQYTEADPTVQPWAKTPYSLGGTDISSQKLAFSGLFGLGTNGITLFTSGRYSQSLGKSQIDTILDTNDYTYNEGGWDHAEEDKTLMTMGAMKQWFATKNSPALTGTPTAPTASSGTNTTQIATTAFVQDAVNSLPEPMIFKGSLGSEGTITQLPTASADNEGFTYKVITAGTYASQTAKVGDTFISDGTNWIRIPSGDEPNGTVTSITLRANSPLSVSSTAALTTSGTRTITHLNSGVTAGTYKSVTVNATGHVTGGTNPTTLAGYGITDAATKKEVEDNELVVAAALNDLNDRAGTDVFTLAYDDITWTEDPVEFGDITTVLTGTLDDVTLYNNIKASIDSGKLVRLRSFINPNAGTNTEFTLNTVENGVFAFSCAIEMLGLRSLVSIVFLPSGGDIAVLHQYSTILWEDIDSAINKANSALQSTDIKDELDPGGNGEIADSAAIADYVEDAISDKVDKVASTDNAIVRFNGTAGAIQNSGVTIDDSNNITAAKFVKSGGTASQFLKADGSVDTTSYATAASDNNKVPYGGVLMPTNPFGGKTLYVNSLDNAFSSADQKYYVTVTKHNKSVNGVTYPYVDSTKDATADDYYVDSPIVSTYSTSVAHRLFDGNYESNITCSANEYIRIRIMFGENTSPSATTSYFLGYPYGTYYLSYYYNLIPNTASQCRVYNKFPTHGIGWHLYTATAFNGSLNNASLIERFIDNADYTRSCVDFIIFGNSVSGRNVGISQIDYQLSRPNIGRDGSTVTKYDPQSLYHTFKWYNEHEETVSINNNGEVTATKFKKSGGTSSQFLKADGSVDSTTYQAQLVSGTNIKTINNQSLLGSGNITIQGGGTGGDTNIIEVVKVNGTALTPDSNKAVNVTVPVYLDDLQGSSSSIHVSQDAFDAKGTYSKPSGGIPKTDLASAVQTSLGLADTSLLPSDIIDEPVGNITPFSEHDKAPSGYAVGAALQEKQDEISDLATIRSGAALGATALQSYTETDPTVPSHVKSITQANITSWNGKYSIPAGGIPVSDLAVDPITSVTMNSNVVLADANGAINLGTVITSHQSIKTINGNTITGTGNVTIPTGDTNVIETIKVNNTALTPTSKAVNITVPTKLEDLEGSSDSIHVTQSAFSAKADKATTLSGYGITDAKIANGVITLGSNTITPLTSHLSIKTINNTTITGTGNVTIATPGTLNTTANASQSTNASEALSGTITLHRISKTGSYSDLRDAPNIADATEITEESDLLGLDVVDGLVTAGAIYNAITAAVNSAKVTIYSGTAAPSNSLGTNGDLYLLTS